MVESLSAVDLAAQTITDHIASGRFVAGQRLPESDLAKQLGVSKNVLREAFARLQQEGILDVQRFRGAMVRRLSFDEVLKILTVNTLLMAWAMREAAEAVVRNPAKRKVVSDLRRGLREMAPRDQRDHLDAFYRIHDAILELTQNDYLSGLMRRGMTSLLKEFIIEWIPLSKEVVDHTKKFDVALEFVERGESEAAFQEVRGWATINRAWVNPLALQAPAAQPTRASTARKTARR